MRIDNLAVKALLLSVASLTNPANAFATTTQAHNSAYTTRNVQHTASSSVLYSATASGTELVPPVTNLEPGKTKEIFDSSVQKTYGRYPLTIVRGEGCKLYDEDGKEYLDFVAGIATCVLGHSHKGLADAVTNQINSLHHVSNLYYIPQQAALAKWLCDNSCADKAFFCNSGAESNEGAIKLARRHASNRGITDPIIIAAKQSFHGRTLAALSATGQPKYHQGFGYGGEMVQGFAHVQYNDIEELKAMVAEMSTTPDDLAEKGRKRGVAAIMLEPLQGEGGIIPGKADYFAEARKLCDETGALLMCDEVQTGMGRTGDLWAHQGLGVEPDVFTSAKALGGGVPIGALMARGAAADVFGPGDHASTYGGNPLACAAGLAVAQAFTDEKLLENVNARGAQLHDGLSALAKKYPTVLGDIRGKGLILGIDSVSCPAGELVGDCMKDGLLLVPAGPNTVRFVPPLIVTEAEIEKALEMFEKTVSTKV
uniref:acetylornithine transaminase n=1 Tax=Leptocylindrus danicus TaxID=163516 RepID=A0A7S2JSE9_9STRA|mmetsp:Transcript_1103/g.1583  ORF Transcript_1103/g.1583 Transcript_1103/m.1583 type:complete len:483 (+) Transcript_1103:143-1591(+)|eukprot:CAMPEP_0116033802 /NCGR_PEP_ID=MMETSP0321-20121206/19212_1 /TAXON_ID=163516 /ORGANISM="Leptocylindrus danicus var. danicus, Strain B650" /LENGTH=482 /DNA_ID=CAMNT_0003509959 /DNA_START=110 /DNA_END=1558 /DNA_ORIENTATION=+